jgi:hypothetical protein
VRDIQLAAQFGHQGVGPGCGGYGCGLHLADLARGELFGGGDPRPGDLSGALLNALAQVGGGLPQAGYGLGEFVELGRGDFEHVAHGCASKAYRLSGGSVESGSSISARSTL